MISYRLPPNESYSQSEIDPYEYPAQDDSDDDGDLLWKYQINSYFFILNNILSYFN